MVAYVDCEGCGCLIRAEESRCPFCDRRGSLISSAALKLFGLAAGLSLATMSCAADEGNGDTISGDEQNADAVTYAGPDDASITDPGTSESATETTTTTQGSVTYDPTDADAVTYAGPDESSSTGSFPETTSTGTETGTGTETSTGTETGSTGSTGTGDTDPNG